jgi:hypothetical protein
MFRSISLHSTDILGEQCPYLMSADMCMSILKGYMTIQICHVFSGVSIWIQDQEKLGLGSCDN